MSYIDDLITQKIMNKYGVSWIEFNESNGSVTDSKGDVVGVAYNNPPRVTGWNGEGCAMSFNGTNQYVQFNSPVFNNTSSIRFRFKSNTISGSGEFPILMDTRGLFNSTNNGLTIINYLGGIYINYCEGQSFLLDMQYSDGKLSDGNFHDILLTFDFIKKKAMLYVDGNINPSIVNDISFTELKNTNNLTIGKSASGDYNYFNGQIDNLEVYNSHLSPKDFHIHPSIIFDNNEYKSYNNTTSQWEVISKSMPSASQFIVNGMESLSPILDRVNGFSPIDLLSDEFRILTWTNSPTPKLSLESPSAAQIVHSINDISLFGVDVIDKISLIANGDVKIGVSFDSATTWLSYKNGQWLELDSVHSGMTVSEINALTSEQIMEAKNQSQTVRFAYSLSGNAEVNRVEMKVSMRGVEHIAKTSDYEMAYDVSTKTIIFNIKKTGTYSVNYVDGQ